MLILLGYSRTESQTIDSTPISEKISIYSDRTLYISGEQIQFAAYLLINENAKKLDLAGIDNIDELNRLVKNYKKPSKIHSNVIYVELITPEGERISGGKYPFENLFGAGCINIPKDILTGIYYLRTYTKSMRNNGPSTYSYISLKIVNPTKPDILAYNYKNAVSIDSTKSNDTLNSPEIITISMDKSSYSTRDLVNIRLKGVDLKTISSLRGLNISVIPYNSILINNKTQPVAEKIAQNNYYYPETNGISLTGRLKDSKTDKSLTNKIVNLSILGDCKEFMAVKTDSFGRFFFKLPDFKGVRDVFLNTETMVDSKSTILVDNDFCQNKISIPTPYIMLNDDEKKVAYNFATNIQVGSHFLNKTQNDSTKYYDKPFYGVSRSKLVLDNYIQLPTIEDYIVELVPTLTVRKQQGRKNFKILSSQAEMNIYRPLVLLDMVAIDNPEKLLALAPQKISHIEIVDAAYVKGDIIYGGIISIFSKKGDFAGIDLPASGIFLDYHFWSDCSINNTIQKPIDDKPDYRNTLLWDPYINLNTNNSAELSFYTADTQGKYIVVLRGVTNDGKEFTCNKSFTIQ